MVSLPSSEDAIILQILADYKDATKNTQVFVQMIQDMANKAKLTFRDVANGLVERMPEYKKEILAANKLIEQAKVNTSQWANEADRAARAFEKIRFAQAKARVSGLFTNDDFMSSIGGKAKEERVRFANATVMAAQANEKLSQSANKANGAIRESGKVSQGATKGLFSLTNVLRTALGTFEAMAIFLVTKFVGDAIKKSIDSLKQLELAMYNIVVAEKTLSRQGIEISPDDFEQIIKSVRELNLAISDTDITKSVADLATGLQDLGLSPEQLEGLSRAAAIIATAEGLTMENVVSQFAQGIAKGGRGLADLDIQVDAAVIKQKALEEGLVANEEAWNNLDAAQRQSIETQALYLIILDSANTKLEELGMLNNSVTMTSKTLSAEWENFTTVMGEVGKPIILGTMTILLGMMRQSVVGATYMGVAYTEFLGVLAGGMNIIKAFADGNINSIDDVVNAFMVGQEKVRKTIYPNIFPTGAPTVFGEDSSMSKFLNKYKPSAPDTPTGDRKSVAEEMEAEQADLQKALEKMNNEILEAQIRLAQDMEDAAIDLGRKLVDIAEEYARKRADAEREYSNKVADINASFRNKIADIKNSEAEANAKARNDELEREAEFQNKMLELKENYLMDLEEALHERDARQVLRLMKQYNLDKTQAEREHALDKQSAARDLQEKRKQFARERADAENERKMKLAEAQRDYQDKLIKLKADEDAERRAAELSYQRKMQDLQREMHNRLSLVAAGLVQEFNLTKQGLDAIYSLYKSYFGAITGVYSAMNTMLGGQLSPVSTAWGGTTTAPSGGTSRTPQKQFAEGGVMIADRPTTVTFGEKTPEIAQFTPIGKSGRDVNKLFSNLSGNAQPNNGSGSVEIGVSLSPDLEARVIQKSSDHVANVITKVRGSKVR